MTPEQWRRVGELFHEALEVPPEQRVAWAERTCTTDPEVHREVLSLLDNDRAIIHGFVEKKVKSAVASFYEAAPAVAGQRVGPYKLLWELGRGGMGTVYLAERDDEEYQTKVAIKLVRPGMDTDIILHRFRRERQILAHLQHPNIARLLDGGTTEDGRPYIVMEYIEGARITEHCETKDLSVVERLNLFLDVCAAVEYAHRHFIVHRDLKPGNILVSSAGAVKLLDFGICKLLHNDSLSSDDTAAGTLGMLTPEYASPEQVRGEPITAASDIYSLAVVLYEILTNQRPHRIEKLTPQALERAICEQEVVRPSAAANKALARRLEGDLDNILLRALQKDPARRYATVENFSEDIRRHLSHQPVKARPDTIGYRTLKFARRHRGVLTAAALISICLLAGIVVSVREARIARANLIEARRLANVFVFDVHDAVRDLPGSTRARQLIVETGLRFLDGLAKNSSRDWELQRELATAYHRIGDVQGNVMGANLGNTQAALESYRKAITLLDGLVEHNPENRDFQLDRLAVQQRIGALLIYTQDTRNALVSFRDAERVGEELLFKNPDDEQIAEQVAQTYLAAGNALRIQSAFAASAGEDSKAVALLAKFSAKHPEDRKLRQTLAAAHSATGMDQTRLGLLQQALDQYKRALALLEQLTREDPANVEYQRILLSTYSHLGDVLGNPKWRNLGDLAGANQAYQQMLSVARRLYEADPANQQAVSDYANALSRVGADLTGKKLAERLVMLRESLRLLQQIQQVNPQNVMNRWDLGHGYGLMGDALLESRDTSGAIRAYQESISLDEALVTAGVTAPASDLVSTHEKLALEAARQGDRESALLHARRALEISDPGGLLAKGRAENEQRFLTPRGTAAMGLTYTLLARAKQVKPADAEQFRRQAADWLRKSLASWQQLEADPAFAPPHRQEMQQVEAALEELPQP